jgi:hypothetical protein
MDLLKETAFKAIDRMPNEYTLEAIMYELNFIGHVLEGLKNLDRSRVISTEELLTRVKEWSK